MQGNWQRRKRRIGAGNRAGSVTVEFALTAPILFLLLFAALEFGRFNMLLQTANNAAFEAARRCIVPGAAASDGVTAGATALTSAGIKGGTVSINPSTITSTTSSVTATVTVPVTKNLWTAAVFCKSTSITKTCTMTPDWIDAAH